MLITSTVAEWHESHVVSCFCAQPASTDEVQTCRARCRFSRIESTTLCNAAWCDAQSNAFHDRHPLGGVSPIPLSMAPTASSNEDTTNVHGPTRGRAPTRNLCNAIPQCRRRPVLLCCVLLCSVLFCSVLFCSVLSSLVASSS